MYFSYEQCSSTKSRPACPEAFHFRPGPGSPPRAQCSCGSLAGNPYFIDLEALVEEGVLTREECGACDFGKKAILQFFPLDRELELEIFVKLNVKIAFSSIVVQGILPALPDVLGWEEGLPGGLWENL